VAVIRGKPCIAHPRCLAIGGVDRIQGGGVVQFEEAKLAATEHGHAEIRTGVSRQMRAAGDRINGVEIVAEIFQVKEAVQGGDAARRPSGQGGDLRVSAGGIVQRPIAVVIEDDIHGARHSRQGEEDENRQQQNKTLNDSHTEFIGEPAPEL
jgi:hypothetical protein